MSSAAWDCSPALGTRNSRSPAIFHPCLGLTLSSGGDREVPRAALLPVSFKARLGRGLAQLPTALCTRAEAWLMPSQLPASILRAGVHRSRRVGGSGIPSRAGLQPSWDGNGMFLCPPYPTRCSRGMFGFAPGLSYPNRLLFAPFCTQGLLQGEGFQPKGGIWGCFPPSFAGGQLAAFPAPSLERGRKSLLAGQTAKTQHRLLKGLYFYFFFKAPEKSPSVLPPFLPPPPPPAPVVPGAEPTRRRLRGKALPFEVA